MGPYGITVVDLRDADSTDPEVRARFAAEFGRALRETGFVALVGHGVPVDLLDASYARAREFFALPDAEKRAFEFPEEGRQRGYTSYGVEHAKDAAVADLKEFWQVGRDLPADHPLAASGEMPPNRWPTAPSGFADTVAALYRTMDALAFRLFSFVEAEIGLPPGHLTEMCRDGNSVMRVIRYPPLGPDAPEGAVRAAAHEDINLMTILPASTTPGLEVLERDGTWTAVNPPPNVMICDTGDMMAYLSNGVMPATTHRVVNPPGAANVTRFSMPFFIHPRPDARLDPPDGSRPPLRAGDFLAERLREIGVL
jgi:isopenicillin N synthase-like dioxygenase